MAGALAEAYGSRQQCERLIRTIPRCFGIVGPIGCFLRHRTLPDNERYTRRRRVDHSQQCASTSHVMAVQSPHPIILSENGRIVPSPFVASPVQCSCTISCYVVLFNESEHVRIIRATSSEDRKTLFGCATTILTYDVVCSAVGARIVTTTKPLDDARSMKRVTTLQCDTRVLCTRVSANRAHGVLLHERLCSFVSVGINTDRGIQQAHHITAPVIQSSVASPSYHPHVTTKAKNYRGIRLPCCDAPVVYLASCTQSNG